MILTALILVTLLIVVAIVIDLGNARQQKRHAQAIADAAALSGASALTDTPPNAPLEALRYAFKSLSLTPPAQNSDLTSCGSNCFQYVQSGKTVQATTPWQGKSNWIYVQACWDVQAQFGQVANLRKVNVCGRATGENTGAGNGPGGPPATSCSTNELSTTVHNPIGVAGSGEDGGEDSGGQPAVTVSASYSASAPIDPASIVFIAPDTTGNLTRLTASQYTLTTSGNTATISYTMPTGLGTLTASLFVTDVNGAGCGQMAWSSCPVSKHDFFTETANAAIADQGMVPDGDADDTLGATALADAALLADADDGVFPGPGQQVGPGATLGATFRDETDINQSKSQLWLNGTKVAATITAVPRGSAAPPAGAPFDPNKYNYTMSYTLPQNTPNGWNSTFLYFWDADVTATGGDCSLAQWAFKFTGGGTVNLVQ
jgi:Flp pilus assembly protein TadG